MKLIEYYPLSINKIILESVNTQPGNPMLLHGIIIQRANSKNRNGRIYPKDVLKNQIDKYVENFVNHNRALGELDHCFTSNDFEVLTKDGWKPFSMVSVGELVLSYNTEKKVMEYKPVVNIIENEYSGDSYAIEGRHIKTQVTPNHKFILEDRYGQVDFHKIEDIYNNRKSYNKSKIIKSGFLVHNPPSTTILKGVPANKKASKSYEKDIEIDNKILAGVIGIWLAEGHVKGNGVVGQTCISQNKGSKLEEIEELLSKSPFDWYTYEYKNGACTIYIKNHQLYNILKDIGNSYVKTIPREVLDFDKESLEALIYYFNLGDGRKQIKNNRIRQNVFTVSKNLIDQLQECLIKSGGSGNITIAHKEGNIASNIDGRDIKATTDLYQLNISTVSGIYLDDRFIKIEKVQHSGKIYCLEVQDNHSFYVRQNNKTFFTGNSQENVVNLKNVSHNIKKIYWDGDDVVGDIEILDSPEFPAGRIAAGLLRRQIPVGISSRGIGSVEEGRDGTSTVNDDFNLLTFDLVSYESTQGSNMMIQEGVSMILENKYKNIDDIIREIICNNAGYCPC